MLFESRRRKFFFGFKGVSATLGWTSSMGFRSVFYSNRYCKAHLNSDIGMGQRDRWSGQTGEWIAELLNVRSFC